MSSEDTQRIQWWRDAKFGMFIHWSVAASLSSFWKGKPTHFCSEWIRHTGRISRADYMDIARNFQPQFFDAAEWVSVARQAGMRYMVFTAKHHDGYCFWDSAVTDFSITRTSGYRDIMRELADEAQQQGIPLGWYYSPRDWHHPDYLPRYGRLSKQGTVYGSYWGYRANPSTGGEFECGCASCRADIPIVEERSEADADLSRYLLFMRRQLEELVVRYGPTALLWFDAQDHSPHVGKTAELRDFLRGLKSDLIINDRIATEPNWGDFAVEEWNIPTEQRERAWESCLCVNGSWAFNAFDLNWKPTAQLIRELCDIVCRGGNLLLNVGPDPNGVIPAATVERLQEMGRWLQVNGEAIYGSTAGAFAPEGALRFTRNGETHYAITTEWPGQTLHLPMIRLKPGGTVSLLGVEYNLRWENGADGCRITLPASLSIARPCDDAWAFRLTGVAPQVV